jgi:hypothetical protein
MRGWREGLCRWFDKCCREHPGEGIGAEENGPDALFSLKAVRGPAAAEKLGDDAAPEDDAAVESPSSGEEDEATSMSEPEDSDDERRCRRRLITPALRHAGRVIDAAHGVCLLSFPRPQTMSIDWCLVARYESGSTNSMTCRV